MQPFVQCTDTDCYSGISSEPIYILYSTFREFTVHFLVPTVDRNSHSGYYSST